MVEIIDAERLIPQKIIYCCNPVKRDSMILLRRNMQAKLLLIPHPPKQYDLHAVLAFQTVSGGHEFSLVSIAMPNCKTDHRSCSVLGSAVEQGGGSSHCRVCSSHPERSQHRSCDVRITMAYDCHSYSSLRGPASACMMRTSFSRSCSPLHVFLLQKSFDLSQVTGIVSISNQWGPMMGAGPGRSKKSTSFQKIFRETRLEGIFHNHNSWMPIDSTASPSAKRHQLKKYN